MARDILWKNFRTVCTQVLYFVFFFCFQKMETEFVENNPH